MSEWETGTGPVTIRNSAGSLNSLLLAGKNRSICSAGLGTAVHDSDHVPLEGRNGSHYGRIR